VRSTWSRALAARAIGGAAAAVALNGLHWLAFLASLVVGNWMLAPVFVVAAGLIVGWSRAFVTMWFPPMLGALFGIVRWSAERVAVPHGAIGQAELNSDPFLGSSYVLFVLAEWCLLAIDLAERRS
jgi:hypothetical protein